MKDVRAFLCRAAAVAVAAFCITARAATWYVSTDGSDGAAGSAAEPFATINHAVSVASSGDEIRVAGGTYSEAVTIDTNANGESLGEVKVIGSCDPDDSWASKPGGLRSTVIPPSKSSPCFYMQGGGTNTVQAFTLTGGKYGAQTSKYSGNKFIQLVVTNNVNSGFNMYGDANSPAGAMLVADSFVAANGADGVTINLNWGGTDGRYLLVVNSTIVDNEACGVNSTYSAIHLYNSVVARNGTYGVYRTYDTGNIVCRDSCAFGNPSGNLQWNSGCKYPDMRGAMLFDPLLDAEGRLTDESPCLKRGGDLADIAAEYSGTADVFGNAWGSVRDMGCFKSNDAIVPLTVLDDVYVSLEGDDQNDGTAAHPVQTVAKGLYLTATNGTCHVGAGVFDGQGVFTCDGVTLVGDSRGGTTLRAPNCATLVVKAQDITVRTLGLRDSNGGIYLGGDTYSKSITVSDVLFKGNEIGLVKINDGGGSSGRFTVSKCIFDGNKTGVSSMLTYADDSLFVSNSVYGISGEAAHRVVNCTFVGNGFGSGSGDSSAAVCPNWQGALAWNCVFVGNKAALASYSDDTRNKVVTSVFYGNTQDFYQMGGYTTAGMKTTDCLFEDPYLTSDYRLGDTSPAINAGTNVNELAEVGITVTEDVDGKARDSAQWDMGCYAADVVADGTLTVTADLGEYGSPSPGYGISRPTVGDTLSFWAPSAEFAVSDALHARFVGWRLERYDASQKRWTQIDSNDTLTYETTYGGGAALRFVWRLKRLYPVILSSDEASVTDFTINGAAASVGKNWVDEGSATLSVAITSSDYTFSTWTGDLDGVGDPTLSTISFDLSVERRIGCSLKGAYHVSPTGSDDGDGSAGTPWKTISHAVSASAAGDVILVAGGLYEDALSITGKDNLTLRGGYNASWQQTPGATPTVIRPADATSDCVYLENVTGTTLDGFVLTGGKRGLYHRGTGSDSLVHMVISNNTSHAIYCDASEKIAAATLNLVSSLVVDNGGYAYHDYNYMEYRSCQWLNCTVVSNKLGGIYSVGDGASHTIRNCIFEGNGTAGLQHQSKDAIVSASCFHGSTEVEVDPRSSYNRVSGLRNGTVSLDPRLGDDFLLAADSPCLKRGEDLSSYEVSVATDLNCEPWNGVYDMGCFKSALPKAYAETYDDVYVAEDGDDGNEGDDPTRPVKSVSMGLLRTAENGTCHVGPGLFIGIASVSRPGVSLVGAGREATVLVPATNVTLRGIAVTIAAANVTVSHLCASNASIGIHVSNGILAQSPRIADARIASCGYGVYMKPEESGYSTTTLTVERTLFENNTASGGCGLQIIDGLLAVSDCLFRNNYCGLHAGERGFCCVHSTFVDNTRAFYCQWGATYRRIYNCIFQGNETAYYLMGVASIDTSKTIVYGNTTEVVESYTPYVVQIDTSGFIREDAQLMTEGKYPYRPASGSPAVGAGLNLRELSTATIVPTTDYYGYHRSKVRWDIGCVSRPVGGFYLLVR